MTNERKPNRLVHEKSPYLLQHAYNPVDWYPWSDEAFDKAKQEDKPIFLSIGYSTCHWCHVMERESFEDAEVAAYLNKHFVSVKVDREERPDIDVVYMKACQLLTGQGGWPLTVLMTPDKKPFFTGTYFPKTARYGSNGLTEILASVVKLWTARRPELERQGLEIVRQLSDTRVRTAQAPTRDDVSLAYEQLRRSFDGINGGFGRAPKFPTPHHLMFLMRYAVLEGRADALDMVKTTLRQMYRGGLFDHVGFGFSRYSTDEKWLVPHFEKMLYDNALLTMTYLEAFQLTGDALFKEVAEKTLRYVAREMTSPEGGFYSAQDADSEGGEGLYYLLTPEQVKTVLGRDDGETFAAWFGMTEKGNFEGVSIPNLLDNALYDTPNDKIGVLLPRIYEYRLGRMSLLKDDKQLTAWNALMTAACAKAYAVLREDKYLRMAERAALFIKTALTDIEGRLYVRYRDGEAAGTGYLDDYAFTAYALISLYEATFDAQYLDAALRYAETMCGLFEDPRGGYFLTAADSETLALRPKETVDGAMPSGNSVAGYVLAKLALLTANEKWEARAEKQLSFLAADVRAYPSAYCFALMAAMTALYPTKEVVVVSVNPAAADELLSRLAGRFIPNVTMLLKTPQNAARLGALSPFVRNYPVAGDRTNIYVCENKTCAVPFSGWDELMARLTEKSRRKA